MARKIKTHVGRDLIQNGNYFTHPPKAILEYVKNGYNYQKIGVDSEVNINIDIDNDQISISDNGRGMSSSQINDNFLVMHGENEDRKKNNPTDGLFGTGKCAFLGIAKILEVKTVQNKKLNHFIIDEDEIKSIEGAKNIPVRELQTDKIVNTPDGSLMIIRKLKSKVKKNKNIISQTASQVKKIIKHKKNTRIFINDNLIETKDPELDFSLEFQTDNNVELSKYIKNTTLKVSVAKSWLENDEAGINIYSKTVHLERTLGGLDNNDYSKFIFGEININELSDFPEGEIFNNNRDGLNKSHDFVKAIINFVGQSVDEVIKKIKSNQNSKKIEEEDKKFDKLCEEIEDKINDFWDNLQTKPENQLIGNKKGSSNIISNIKNNIFTKGDEIALTANQNNDFRTLTDKKLKNKNEKNDFKNRKEDKNQHKNSKLTSKNTNSKSRYSVIKKDLGVEETRCLWRKDKSTIYINTGHKQIISLRKQYAYESKFFKFFIQDLAFSEFTYAIVRQYMDEKIVTNAPEAFYQFRSLIDEFSKDNLIKDDN